MIPSSYEGAPKESKPYKIILLGDYGTGKTTLFHTIVTQLVPNSLKRPSNNGSHTITLPVETVSSPALVKLTHEGVKFEFSVWDTENQEKYGQLPPLYLQDADVVMYLYDITDRDTLENLPKWIEYFTDNNTDDGEVVSVVLGNKLDESVNQELAQSEVEEAFGGLVNIVDFISATDLNAVQYLMTQICGMLLVEEKPKKVLDEELKNLSFIGKNMKRVENNCFYQ